MKFIADVNIAQLIIKRLRENKHDVIDVKKERLSVKDEDIIKLALQNNLIILTHDRDFEVLTKYPRYRAGTILIRLVKADVKYFYERLAEVLSSKNEEELLGALTIITELGFEIYPYRLTTNP